jgi:hypothetical protein
LTDGLPKATEASYLTDALRRCGALAGDNQIRDVMVESARSTLLSRIIRLRLTYTSETDRAPASLFLKTKLEGTATPPNSGRQETAFYNTVAAQMPAGLVPRCYDAWCDADGTTWHLLLEDLTDSHMVATVWPLPPTAAQCESIIRARARFHAAWWDDPRLGVTVGNWTAADRMQQNLQRFADKFAGFCDRQDDRLPRERRDLYEQLLAAAQRLSQRYHTHRNLTIVQGDAHVWNCFLRKDGADDTRLFDWDSWSIDPATDDLAYMIAMHWYPDRRCHLERPLLEEYHAILEANGVSGYTRAALADDYRLSVLWQIMTPIWQEAIGIPPVIWWNDLERIMLAVDDLNCRTLLD